MPWIAWEVTWPPALPAHYSVASSQGHGYQQAPCYQAGQTTMSFTRHSSPGDEAATRRQLNTHLPVVLPPSCPYRFLLGALSHSVTYETSRLCFLGT